MIDIKVRGSIAFVTLKRIEAANALSTSLLDEINSGLEFINKNPSIYCTILIGDGDKAFCAGADLKERSNMTDEEVVQTVRYIGETVLRIEKMRMPVIAALNGVAYGGGLEIALACDIRIAADHVKLGLTETSLGIIPGSGGTQRLPRLIGVGKAKWLIYAAKPIDVIQAEKMGLVEKVVEKGQFMDEVIQLAEEITSNGPIALQQAKLAINQGMQMSLDQALEFEHASYQKTIPTEDRKEGLLAFKEKREPIYKGK